MKKIHHNPRIRSLIAAAIMTLGAAGSAQAATIFTYDSDAEFLASGFTKVGGVNVRWGNNATNGDWEFSVVDGSDSPMDQQQVRWSNHGVPELKVDFDDEGISADLGSSSGDIAESSWMADLGSYNTVLFRAKSTNGLELTDISVNGDLLTNLLSGDSNAQYIGISMADFISGSLSLKFTADAGSGSDPGAQIKFGSLPTASVPEPGSLGLVLLGIAGVFGATRRRFRKS